VLVPLANLIDRMAKDHPINQLAQLLPWSWESKMLILAAA
jgi:hypothetical protein